MFFLYRIQKILLVVGVLTGTYFLQPFYVRASFAGKEAPAILGVFQGITPCGNTERSVPQISTNATCEMMIWHLLLNQDPATGKPTRYELHSSYGMSQPNTNGIAGGGTKIDLEGSWTILRGTKNNPDAVVYQLNPDDPKLSIYFLKMGDSLLHVLTPEKTMMVGNGGWSYTLNRTDRKEKPDPTAPEADAVIERIAHPAIGDGSGTLGVFQGRTSCHDIVYAFTGIQRDPACMKVKWQLTLYKDPKTDQPTTYQFKGTTTTREGTWTTIRSPKTHPGAIIYALIPGSSEHPVYFLKADDNHLFLLNCKLNFVIGDPLWSFTLSKVH